MVGCSAPNCSNNSRHGKYKFYRFPACPERRALWVKNCKRENWSPTRNNQLCHVHFEETHFEQNRQDGRKLLAPYAVPTIFNIPKIFQVAPSSVTKSQSYVQSESVAIEPGTTNLTNHSSVNTEELVKKKLLEEINKLQKDLDLTKSEVILQKRRVEILEKELEEKDAMLKKFLNEQQINSLKACGTVCKWSDENILKGLKLRFALGKHGYQYLHSSGYPSPSYSTLNQRVQLFQLNFGILENVFHLLKEKVECMKPVERDCQIMIDEMEICDKLDFDKFSGQLVGNITLGDVDKRGHHLTVTLARGLNTNWKQIVAVDVTGPSTTGVAMRKVIMDVISNASAIGLNVCGLTSDMGSTNKAMWSALGVGVTRNERNVSFVPENGSEEVCVLADPSHLVKNWRTAINSCKDIILPKKVTDEQQLVTNVVNGRYIADLFEMEKNQPCGSLKLLHHLNEKCVNPSHFEKMNVGFAQKYLSLKTAAALETAVRLSILPPEALTTAWFIRLLNDWFEILMSRCLMKSITATNKERKYEFLNNFVEIIQDTVINNGWKPLNTGSILSTLSFMKISKGCFDRGYRFVLGSRLSQDALENVFSQVRRKAGSNPTALAAKRAIRLISISQYMCDLRNTNYQSDSDYSLLNLSDILNQDHALQKNDILNTDNSEDTVSNKENNPRTSDHITINVTLSDADYNNLYYLGGACVTYVMKKKICNTCSKFLIQDMNNVQKRYKYLTQYSDFGNLKYINETIFEVIIDMEKQILKNRTKLMETKTTMKKLLSEILDTHAEKVPPCCSVLELILNHFCIIRGYAFTCTTQVKRKCSTGSASTAKKSRPC